MADGRVAARHIYKMLLLRFVVLKGKGVLKEINTTAM